MMPEGCATTASNLALGTSIAEFFMKNHGEFHVQYIIWQQRIWNAETEIPKAAAQWRGMSDRGSCTANHQDHVHVSFISRTSPPLSRGHARRGHHRPEDRQLTHIHQPAGSRALGGPTDMRARPTPARLLVATTAAVLVLTMFLPGLSAAGTSSRRWFA
ncbi:MAG: hypothetical protein V9E82_03990 [Candidatus Nanopelagicales bacterium]